MNYMGVHVSQVFRVGARAVIVIHLEKSNLMLEQMPKSVILAASVIPDSIFPTPGKTDFNKGSLLLCEDRLLLFCDRCKLQLKCTPVAKTK